MNIKQTKSYLYVHHLLLQISGFFGEIHQATRGRRLAVLWVIALFFGVLIMSKYYFVVFANKHSLGVDMSNISSNDHIFFNVEKNAIGYDEVQRGQYIMFKTDKMMPHVSSDAAIIKKVIGKSGDHVQVKGMNVYVNGKQYGSIHPEALKKLHRSVAELQKDYYLPANTLFLMGSYERSFDSRYWGYLEVAKDQKLNLATPMLF